MKLVNDLGHSEEKVRQHFADAYIDNEGIVRWMINQQIPFNDLLTDFRTLGLITEEVQLYSNLLREKETDEFWEGYFGESN